MGVSILCSALCCADVLDGLEVCCRNHWMPAGPWSLHLLQVFILDIHMEIKCKTVFCLRKPDANWGSAADAQTFVTAMKSTQELTNNPDHIKNYRPKVLVLTGIYFLKSLPLYISCLPRKPCS